MLTADLQASPSQCVDIVECAYESDFDCNGVFYWLGTNGNGSRGWSNPALLKDGGCEVRCLGGGGLYAGGRIEDVIEREVGH